MRLNAVKNRLNLQLPMRGDIRLLYGSAFAFRGEGSQYCKWPKRGRIRLVIQVSACDKGLVEFVAHAWGTLLETTRHKLPECNPVFSTLPDPRLTWRTRAYGKRAVRIVRTYKQIGILGTEKELKLKKLEERTGLEIL